MPRRPRAGVVLLLATLATACHSWRPVPLAPADSVRLEREVRVERVDGFVAELVDVTITRDTVTGRLARDGADGRVLRIPRDSIRTLTARRTDAGKSVALGVGVYLGALVVGVAVAILAIFAGLGG